MSVSISSVSYTVVYAIGSYSGLFSGGSAGMATRCHAWL